MVFKDEKYVKERLFIDKLAIIISLLSGLIGSSITLVATKYMTITKDRKFYAIKLIEIINRNLMMLEKLIAVKSKSKEDINEYYNNFLKDMGAIDSIAKFYFSDKVNLYAKSFIARCDGVYLILEIKFNLEKLKKINEEIEEEARKIVRLESKEEKLEEGYITVTKMKHMMAERSDILERKSNLELLKKDNERLHTQNIENKYRLRKVFSTESEKEMFEETKKFKDTLINSIEGDYKIKNRASRRAF